MDIIDQANMQEEKQRAAILAAYSLPEGESLQHCRDCGGTIPEARRQAAPGCTRCIVCQEAYEA